MKFLRCWKQKAPTEHHFRRIYVGDVPYLQGDDAEPLDTQSHNGPNSASQHPPASGQHATATSTPSKGQLGTAAPTPTAQHSKNVISTVVVEEAEDSANRPRSVRRKSMVTASELTNGQTEKFPDNLVITSRYTVWNFIPKNLFEQFRRIVNFYFLVIAFIQTVIDSPVHPVTAVSPLCFVILVTAIKQGYEDWLRHKNDEQVNNRKVKIIRDGKMKEIRSRDIHVGDVIKLESDEQVPTDLLLVGCSDPFLRCQINTANLDGETNLKLRYCPSGLPHYKTLENLRHLHLIIECEQPNANLYEFNGSLLLPANKLNEMHWSPSESMAKIEEGGNAKKQMKEKPTKPELNEIVSGLVRQGMSDFLSIPLSMDNLVLRGTRLKNTEFIYGIVVYTGRDTRLARNSEKSQSKFSTVEKAVNYYLMFFICMLACLVAFSCAMHFCVDWYPGAKGNPWYIQANTDMGGILGILNTVASFTVLFNYIIPISLYVTIELQKFMGSKFFIWDNEMVDDEGREPLCNTSDLNEELGQIEYLFSDKTGTLTQNIMQFRHCSIDTVRYEYKEDHKLYISDSENQNSNSQSRQNVSTGPINISQKEKVLLFFKTLALCHSVQVVPKRRGSLDVGASTKISLNDLRFLKKEKKSELQRRRESLVTPEPSQGFQFEGFDRGSMEFQASSPDEKALLESAEQLGIIYHGEKEDVMSVEVFGQIEKFKRLMHLEFDADRKCMSVIVENQKGEKWLLTKGAESTIIPKCDDGPTHETLKHVMDFALMGLRTLAVSVRKLTNSEYEGFNNDLRAARRQIKNRQLLVREVYAKIETHMTLVGATGVEDQLQDFVPETLQAFAAAGIRVWMLTGDKLETGVNVAVSCGLITASTKQYIVNKMPSPDDIRVRLTQIRDEMDKYDNTCFVIDGDSLAIAFKDYGELLRETAMKAFRVVCCRMAPLQKAQVVQMVKNSPGSPTTCAVGDGANDCAMILASHIGIGILGKEGRQAARCADFALAKFGHLRKAILVHGHWYYVRLANLANYFFYKNVVFVLPQFFFNFNSNFSTEALFNGLFLMNYNIFFASCPIFFYGLLEQPYSAETLLRNPHLYKKNRRNALMTVKYFLPWLLSAVWHSLVVYYLPYFAWDNFDEMDNIMSFGTVVFTGVVITSNNKMAVETKYLTWWYFGAQLYSYATYFLITSIYSEIDLSFLGISAGDFVHVYFNTMSSLCFWLLMILVSLAAILPDIAFASLRHSWKHLVRHFKSFGKYRKWLKIRRKSIPLPKPTLLFTKRSGSITISSSTINSYLPSTNA